MSEHTAKVTWRRGDAAFTDNRYSRVHEWAFDGGATVRASASPTIVRPPFSDATCVDPEEAFVASLSSCHMLWFLSLAAARGVVVESYEDHAGGVLGKDERGREAITTVTLRPRVVFASALSPADEDALHHAAHDHCFLANAVKCKVLVLPTR
jgi:organic hydroperoxide reductase OsmC/OhrA